MGDDRKFRRELGFLDVLMIGVGGMVGGAIFIFPGSTGMLSGDASFLSWLIAGFLIMSIALLYIELASAFPRTGGPAYYPFETITRNIELRRFLSYLEGAGFFIGWLIAIVVSALSLSSYMNYIVPGTASHMVSIAIISILLAFIVNALGIKVAGKTNLVLTSLLLAILLTFVGKAITIGSPPFIERQPEVYLNGLPAAIALSIGAYGAWVAITATAEEIKDPEKNIPRGVLASLLTVTIIYTLVVFAFESVVTPELILSEKTILYSPLGYAADMMRSPLFSRYVLPLGAITAIFTTMLVGMMGLSRVLYAMGEIKVLPRYLARVYYKTRVPLIALGVTTLVSMLLALFPEFFFKFIVVGLVIGTDIPYAINILSFIGLRYYRKDVRPSFRVPFGLPVSIIAFLVLVFVTVSLGLQAVSWNVILLALILLFYLLVYAVREKEKM